MSELSLARAKRRYPYALYAYTHIAEPRKAMETFLADPTHNPVFRYAVPLSVAKVDAHIARLEADLADATSEAVIAFLTHRLREAQLLLQFVALRGAAAVSAAALKSYRSDMAKVYGTLKLAYFNGALDYLAGRAAEQQKETLFADVQREVTWTPAQLPAPDPAHFRHYRTIARQTLPGMFAAPASSTDFVHAFEAALDQAGLLAQGWRIQQTPHAARVSVHRHRKTINIGVDYEPTNGLRLQQVIAHEVYGHARRFNHAGAVASPKEEEGVAILLEQLVAPKFSYKRLLRYLAVCLAWGIDGTPRDFRDTYRMMLPLTVLMTKKTGKAARETAFKETLRAFRGGNPAVPGMILLKDKVYIESNLMVWQYLAERGLDAAAFARFIDGHDTMLEKDMA